ncbi:MAG TPA: hypothetical protein VK843_19925 [Planctomycetota bacterium]|nr:hypothetical protein [Planctomycetota bacterium]
MPTLARLKAFRAVLVYSNPPFGNSVQLGNTLHDYVDKGGGVVIAAFANVNPGIWCLQGTWASAQYEPIKLMGQPSTVHLALGTRHVPNHPLFQFSPVVSFDGGSSSYHGAGGLAANSTRLADWSDGSLFAAERNGLPGRVLSLNFAPASSDYRGDLWVASTDGDNLMANALAYAGHLDCGVRATYCTAKVNSIGCTPGITAAGNPSAVAVSGFIVTATQVRNQKPGVLLYGISGRAAVPFGGGFLCLQSPIRRSSPVNSGGSALPASDCSGAYVLDVCSFAHGLLGGTPLPALRIPGTLVDCQWWGRDPGFAAPSNITLSDGVEYLVCP